MIESINFLISNFLTSFLVTFLCLKIFKIFHSKWYVLSVQIFDVCSSLLVLALGGQTMFYLLSKFVSTFFIVLFITDSFNPKDFFGILFSFYILLFAIGGIALFLCEVFSVSLENLFALKFSRKLMFLMYFAIISYVFAVFCIVSHLENKNFLKNHLIKLSFFMCDKHIEIMGFIDSGNCLYDNLTKKPVIIVSKRALERFLSPKELNNFLCLKGRFTDYETISGSGLKMKVFDVGPIKYTNGKTITQKNCVIGVMDKIFENAKYDCLLHRDFM